MVFSNLSTSALYLATAASSVAVLSAYCPSNLTLKLMNNYLTLSSKAESARTS